MPQKGFSLMEVLFSLLLVSTLAIGLLRQLQQVRQLLYQFILEAGASQFLDEVEEYLWLKRLPLPAPVPPYGFHLIKEQGAVVLKLDYFQNQEPMTRTVFQAL